MRYVRCANFMPVCGGVILMTNEVWKPVKGYEGLYEVSDLGNIRSLDREVEVSNGRTAWVRKYPGKEIAKTPQVGGYLRTRLSIKGKSSTPLIHRVVLEAFVGECPEGMETRHLDGDPTNNRLSNLTWGTSQENKWDTVDAGNNPHSNRTHCPRQHLLKEPNLYTYKREKRCRACHQAYSALHPKGEHKNERLMKEESDARYRTIMCSVKTSCEWAQ